MFYPATKRLGVTAILMCSLAPCALAQAAPEATTELTPITVERPAQADGPMSTVLVPRGMNSSPVSDGAAILATAPGLTAGRMGGHGLELVIRGQQQNQLNIIDAGSFTYGACPNRMDPPTSSASFLRADEVLIERGYASVTHGPGGSGGTVVLNRKAPELASGKRVEGHLSAGAGSNGTGTELGGQISVDLGRGFYAEAAAERKNANNYVDGSGRTVRSAYDQTGAGVTLGYAANGIDLALDYDYSLVEDSLYPGAGMDSPFDETTIYRLRGGMDVNAGALRRIEGSLFSSEVDHVMDNYSLRPLLGMAMRTPATSDTTGGKLEAHLDFGRTTAKLGIDHQSNNRFAMMYAGMPPMIPLLDNADPSRSRFLMWPDVTIKQTGIYLETETELSPKAMLKAGLRYDRVKASAGAANFAPALDAGNTPNTYYTMQYGTTFNTAREEDNVGGLLRLEYALNPDTTVFAGLSRSVRTADATERAMGRANWVGNPDIDPEKHHQLDLGLQIDKGAWYLNASAYADWVDDYILRDQFSVAGVTTYRNVSAELSGIELSAGWEQGPWAIWGDATWTKGRNTTDKRDIAQIPPLQGQISLAYGIDGWRAGARVNWALDQNQIDPARDPGPTPGFATLDLFGSYELTKNAIVLAGINNVTDETYANHLSRANLFDPTVTQVNEAGRTFYLKVEAKF
ncbi:iron complex outermembrane receptor protein [Roseovarius halotolerans]|uniref:Vitamin B12 transporter BtuB n=1 Tax=Roseovarius halotolerans TaxID=505353 RepID=A0A1X6ZTY1_9RHOB|nr:TonB-dependent receptor [Roseovarius halotolerans]RKT27814.1 iron complex outermembrane receptor protein [Roseovarius halotolerans]SLN61104.1 Vitamin B12 transporter BtuB [Roseovarius halotolerans]